MTSPTRTIVIGDVHGCLEELDELLRLVEHRPGRDRLVFIGDLLDRGPDPVGVVRRVRGLHAECLLGNHEEKHLRWRAHERRAQREPGYRNPMQRLGEAKLRTNAALSEDDWAWIDALPVLLRLAPGWVAVHAGLEPARALDAQRDDALLRIRYVDAAGRMAPGLRPKPGSVPWSTRWSGPDSIVYGHEVHDLDEPRVDEPFAGVFCWGIDTGCAFGGHLTALELPSLAIASTRARRAYAEWRDPSD